MNSLFRIIVLGFFITLMSSTHASAQLKIVVTFSVLADVVKNVAGEDVQIKVLVGPNGDAHTYEPTPQDGIALSNADLIFENGLHFETWLDDLYQSSHSKAKRVVLTAGIVKPLIIDTHEQEIDPHAWHNISYVKGMVRTIEQVLCAYDPKYCDHYTASAQAYLAQLDTLEQWVKREISTIPESQRKLVTSHDTFGYFAKAYGLQVIGQAITSATTEASDPSAQAIAQLVNTIKASGVKTIFTENISSSRTAEILAKDAGVVVAPPLYTDALGDKGSEGDTYIKMMRYNVMTIVKGLN